MDLAMYLHVCEWAVSAICKGEGSPLVLECYKSRIGGMKERRWMVERRDVWKKWWWLVDVVCAPLSVTLCGTARLGLFWRGGVWVGLGFELFIGPQITLDSVIC